MTRFAMLDINFCVLKIIADELDETGSVGVTLFVGGSVLSGDLISPKTYFKEITKQYESAECDPKLNEISKLINKQLGEIFAAAIEKAALSKSTQEEPLEGDTIYLKNIKMWTPHTSPLAYNNALMELHVDAIDGFILGTPSIDSQ
jgi:hypothetical protein